MRRYRMADLLIELVGEEIKNANHGGPAFRKRSRA